jgi:hypothetical protein
MRHLPVMCPAPPTIAAAQIIFRSAGSLHIWRSRGFRRPPAQLIVFWCHFTFVIPCDASSSCQLLIFAPPRGCLRGHWATAHCTQTLQIVKNAARMYYLKGFTEGYLSIGALIESLKPGTGRPILSRHPSNVNTCVSHLHCIHHASRIRQHLWRRCYC